MARRLTVRSLNPNLNQSIHREKASLQAVTLPSAKAQARAEEIVASAPAAFGNAEVKAQVVVVLVPGVAALSLQRKAFLTNHY